MTPFLRYRRIEELVVRRIAGGLRGAANEARRLSFRLLLLARQRVTILFVPHVGKKIIGVNLSNFSLVFGGFLLVAVVAAILVAHADARSLRRNLSADASNLSAGRRELQQVNSSVSTLVAVSHVLGHAVHRMMSAYGFTHDHGTARAADPSRNPLRMPETAPPSAPTDLTELRNVAAMMGSSAQSILRFLGSYESLRRVLKELPTEWPVKGGRGTITTLYGPAIDPVTHRMYLSTGVDIAYWEGAPIVASANGVVVMTAYEPLGYGNFVFIRHHFGFYTRYAHLMQIYVHEGEHVKQGQIIGALGSSGLSAGPYLHFEVWLGSQVVDPMSFLNMRGHRTISLTASPR